MRREPLWMRLAKRPSWKQNDPPLLSDYDPLMKVAIVINRTFVAVDRLLDAEERKQAERQRGRTRRLGR